MRPSWSVVPTCMSGVGHAIVLFAFCHVEQFEVDELEPDKSPTKNDRAHMFAMKTNISKDLHSTLKEVATEMTKNDRLHQPVIKFQPLLPANKSSRVLNQAAQPIGLKKNGSARDRHRGCVPAPTYECMNTYAALVASAVSAVVRGQHFSRIGKNEFHNFLFQFSNCFKLEDRI